MDLGTSRRRVHIYFVAYGRLMPRYYFDLREGNAFVRDDEGVELPEATIAQLEAAETLAEMVGDLVARGVDRLGHPMSVEVRNCEGPVFLLGFVFAKKPTGP